jgi:phosphatidylserine/phosphatidylglycerophosphate/cardiolipin synthase-like enzyme
MRIRHLLFPVILLLSAQAHAEGIMGKTYWNSIGALMGQAPQALQHQQSEPNQAVPAQGSASIGFTPGNAEGLVVQTINAARQSISVAAYSFTSKPIAKALIEAHKRGVRVQVVLDKSQRTERYSSATFLANMGIPVRIDDRYAIMHHKFMVIDGRTVETGSFNYTSSAARRNAENVIVLRDNPRVAQVYAQQWQRLWNESKPYAPRY